jgi:RNA polymerase sigma-70 factor (ECF subfamily)
VDERDWLAERFEHRRQHLRGVAYRMLGSVADAEDAVQEAWVRLDRADSAAVDDLDAWLTTVVARICLDVLRARRARREGAPDEPGGLPEPIVSFEDEDDPGEEAALADSVGLALLVVLDTLAPAERLAFVLHDMFAVPFERIAPVVGRTPVATRQLVSRARRRVQGASPAADTDRALQRKVIDAFLKASREGDFDGLIAVLDPGVTFHVDAGRAMAPRTTVGAGAVAREILLRGSPLAGFARPATVNGMPGVIVRVHGRVFSVVGFSVAGGRITEIDVVADPEKLGRLDAPAGPSAAT